MPYDESRHFTGLVRVQMRRVESGGWFEQRVPVRQLQIAAGIRKVFSHSDNGAHAGVAGARQNRVAIVVKAWIAQVRMGIHQSACGVPASCYPFSEPF